MNLKRIVAAVLAIIMLLALAACGEVGQSGGDSSSEAISESDALAEARSYIKSGIASSFLLIRLCQAEQKACLILMQAALHASAKTMIAATRYL